MSGPVPGQIDAGIAGAVTILQQNGIETFESCEGGEGHSFPEPTVRFHGRHSGFRAFTVAMEHGLPVLALRLAYHEHDRVLEGPEWEILFREKVFARASAIEARSDATGTGAAEGESATGEAGDAQKEAQ